MIGITLLEAYGFLSRSSVTRIPLHIEASPLRPITSTIIDDKNGQQYHVLNLSDSPKVKNLEQGKEDSLIPFEQQGGDDKSEDLEEDKTQTESNISEAKENLEKDVDNEPSLPVNIKEIKRYEYPGELEEDKNDETEISTSDESSSSEMSGERRTQVDTHDDTVEIEWTY